MSFNFMAAVTICIDFGARENKVFHCFHFSIVFSSICHEVMGPDAVIFVFWVLSFKPAFSLSFFTFIKRLFSSSSLSAYIRVVSSAYLRLLIFLLAILIPACASSSPVFLMMYSAYKLPNVPYGTKLPPVEQHCLRTMQMLTDWSVGMLYSTEQTGSSS